MLLNFDQQISARLQLTKPLIPRNICGAKFKIKLKSGYDLLTERSAPAVSWVGGHYHGKNPANLFFMIFIVNHGKNPTNLFFMIFIVYEFK